MPTPLRIIFAGAGAFGIPTLQALKAAGYEIVQVITQPDRPAGRGRTLTPTPIADAATSLGLPVIKTNDINALGETDTALEPADLLVVIAFGQKIAERVVHHARLGSVNLHASLLPRHRGAAPVNAAILSGDEITGNSIIRLAQKMDAGAVLGQSILKIDELETAGELHDRLAADGAPLMLRVIHELAVGTAKEVEQDHAQATLARKLSRATAQIDWSKPAGGIAHQIRGLFPWPGCRVEVVDGEKVLDTITLVRTRAVDDGHGDAGTITPIGTIGTGDGRSLEIVELQPAGKRPMSLAAYRNGKRWETGLSLRSV